MRGKVGKVARVVLASAFLLVGLVLMPDEALANHSLGVPPDAEANYAQCNVNWSTGKHGNGGTFENWNTYRVRCNYGVPLTQLGSEATAVTLHFTQADGTTYQIGSNDLADSNRCHNTYGATFIGTEAGVKTLVYPDTNRIEVRGCLTEHREFTAYQKLTVGIGSGAGHVTRQAKSVKVVKGTTAYPTWPEHFYDGGIAGDPPPTRFIEAPQTLCERSFTSGGGEDFVKLHATVLNPRARATDTVELRFSWDTATRPGPSTAEVQLPPISQMPATGWRGICKVTRVVENTDEVENPIGASGLGGSQEPNEITDFNTSDSASAEELWKAYKTTGPDQAFLAPGAIAGTTTGAWLTYQHFATGAAVKTARVPGAGWFIGGAAAIAAGSLWVANKMDSSYQRGCGLFDALKSLFGSGCPEPKELESSVALRSQVQYLDPNGQPQTKTQLAGKPAVKTMVALSEVLIDPRRKEAGAQTLTVTQPVAAPNRTQTQSDQFNAYAPGTATDTEAGEGSDSDCDFSGFKLLKILNPFNMLRTIKCALKWAFVPPDSSWANVMGRADTVPPFSALVEFDQTRVVISDTISAAVGGNSCWSADFSTAAPGDAIPSLHARLPTPSDSGCAGTAGGARTDWDNQAGDLFGFRESLRLAMVVALYLVATLKVVRALLPNPEQNSAVEPGA